MIRRASIGTLVIAALLFGAWPVAASCPVPDNGCCPRPAVVTALCCCTTELTPSPATVSGAVERDVVAITPTLLPPGRIDDAYGAIIVGPHPTARANAPVRVLRI